jgi:hypothetical protein
MDSVINYFSATENFELLIYIILCSAALILILTITLVIQGIKMGKLKKKYNKFMQGATGLSIEEALNKQIDELNELKIDLKELNNDVNNIRNIQLKTIQKVGVVKYNAFREMGGNLSFVLTLLDANNNGTMLNAMHTREGCYTYLKQVEAGQISVQTSDEEKKSLEKALKR